MFLRVVCLSIVCICLFVGCSAGSALGTDLDRDAEPMVPFKIYNIGTKSVRDASALPDLLTNSRYKSDEIVFHSISKNTSFVGSPSGSLGRLAEEEERSVSLDGYYMAVFELTQGQWKALTGDLDGATPWDAATPANMVNALGVHDERPAFNLNPTIISKIFTNHPLLKLPSDDEWETATRFLNTQLYGWGNDVTTATVATYAVVRETNNGETGPQKVGSKFPTQNNLYDAHGNVWEWTANGHLRGGSWNDSIILARSANKLKITSGAQHALAGVRFALPR